MAAVAAEVLFAQTKARQPARNNEKIIPAPVRPAASPKLTKTPVPIIEPNPIMTAPLMPTPLIKSPLLAIVLRF